MTHLHALFLSLLLAFTSTAAMAGAGHSHGPINQAKAQARAEHLTTQLINRGIIPSTWQNRTLKSVKKARRSGSQVWKAHFAANAEQSSEPSLYLFMSLSGSYMDINFTGR